MEPATVRCRHWRARFGGRRDSRRVVDLSEGSSPRRREDRQMARREQTQRSFVNAACVSSGEAYALCFVEAAFQGSRFLSPEETPNAGNPSQIFPGDLVGLAGGLATTIVLSAFPPQRK